MPSLCMKNGKRRWRGAVMVNGLRSRQWFDDASKDSERAAAAWEATEKARLLALPQASQETATAWTIEMWANAVLDHAQARMAPATYAEKKTAFKLLKKALGNTFDLSGLTIDVAEEHLDTQAEERSGNAANKDRKTLAAGWKFAQKKYRRDDFPQGENPWMEVERYQETRHPRYVPPMDDMRAVLNVVTGQDHAMLVAMLNLAARRSEVFRLTWDDVDFVRGKVRLKTRKTKTGEWREDWLPMTKECRAALRAQWQRRASGQESVFAQEDDYNLQYATKGQPFQKRNHFMGKVCKKALVKPFGFHAIRHLAAGALYEAGYLVPTIQKVLRHQSPNTTVVYLRNHGYDVDQLEAALENALSADPKPLGKVIPITNEKRP